MPASGAASSIVQLLALARSRRRLRSALECTALGLAAAGIGAAAALISGAETDDRASLLACALLCGAAMAGTWWVERAKLTQLQLAQRLDRQLCSDGALATAFELRARGAVSDLVLLLEQRVLATVDPARLRSALPPAGWIWLAPPAAAAALVALALELPRSALPPNFERAGSGLAGTRPSALQQARELLERDPPVAVANDPRSLELRKAELQAALNALGPVGTRTLEAGETQAAADELALALSQALARLPQGLPQGAESPAGASAGAVAGSAAEGGDSGLAIGSAERTMVGSNRPATAPVVPAPASEPSAQASSREAGTLAGRWWPERYDPVVQGWRRTLAARAQER